MRGRPIQLRFRKGIRKSQQQFEDLGQQAELKIERHFFKRFSHLARVKRFVIGWLALVLLLMFCLVIQNFDLSGYFQTLKPVAGGIYNEGIIGRFTNANPLFATNDVDTSVSRLIFSGLFTYNDKNQLVGDLAQSYSVDTKGTTYTVYLKHHLTWQDGKPLTSSDVAFTYKLIQNPDTQSPLQNSFEGVAVTAPNPTTIVFKLPDPLTSFPYSLTNGIVPEHLLGSVAPVNMRSADFDTNDPIGSGPFKWQAVQVNGDDPFTSQEQIALTPFAHYVGGKPKLTQFVVHAYATANLLTAAFSKGQLNGAEGYTSVPSSLKSISSLEQHNFLLTAATMVFFKTSSGVLSDSSVRQALVKGANVPGIISNLAYPTRAVREPLLAGQLGYNRTYLQDGYNVAAAKAELTSDGWIVGKDGIRAKAGTELSFNLTAADTPEYHQVVQELQKDWKVLGVQVEPLFLGSNDFQSAVSEHEYDSVLYGISIGVDPDVFVYWDSSQADIRSANRLNLSEYKNTTADDALEAGRTRLNPALRAIKYEPFLAAWQQDNPALGLYQPRLLYLTDGPVAGLDNQNTFNTATDRYNNVQNWEIRLAKVTD
jgi:peptide/nickel transport system substrate-binding protein